MSRENLATVQRFAEAFKRRDIGGLKAVVQPDANFEGFDGVSKWAAHW